ncbi:MAG: flagellar biosynthetic protein FliO [Chlamydiales bacterium]|nr:flagellar biosynthetic protein FliO [Chlamydiales bacterium]
MISWIAQLSPSLETSPVELPSVTEMTTNYGSAIAHMLLTFTAVIALLFVSFWFLRRLIQNRLQKGGGDQAIQILEKRMISPKTMLYWIEVEGKKILIAESHLEVRKIESYTIDSINK